MDTKKIAFWLLAIGMLLLLAGAVLSVLQYQPWGDYTLISGAVLIIVRGFFRSRERDDQPKDDNNNAPHNP